MLLYRSEGRYRKNKSSSRILLKETSCSMLVQVPARYRADASYIVVSIFGEKNIDKLASYKRSLFLKARECGFMA